MQGMRRSGVFGVAALATALAVTGAPAVPVPAAAQEAGPDNIWLTERSGANIAHGGGLHEAPQNTRSPPLSRRLWRRAWSRRAAKD